MKKFLVLLFLLVPFCCKAQYGSNQTTYTQSNDTQWEKLGYVWLYKPDPGNKFISISCGKALVYGSFDGNKMKYNPSLT